MNIQTRAFKTTLMMLTFLGSAGIALAGQPRDSGNFMPATLRPALYQALAQEAGDAYRINNHGCASLPTQSLRACFDGSGAHFTGNDTSSLALRLVAFGRGEALRSVSPGRAVIRGNKVSYSHGVLTEWWRVLPVGFEQGFTVEKRPSGNGDLVFGFTASAEANLSKSGLAWGNLRYGQLVVTDANGHVVPATLSKEGKRIRIAVHDAQAVYPLVVDPLVWIEQNVTPSDGGANDQFGGAVAVDGDTALIGAWFAAGSNGLPYGAAYIFTRANGVWVEGQKLVASPATPVAFFGASVALGGDTALVGARNANAVYVFTKTNDTWSQVQKLTVSGASALGTSVAIDGDMALIGAYSTAYIFTKTNGTWTEKQELSGDGTSYFGHSVALDGATALVGAEGDSVSYPGAVFVFTKANDGSWSLEQELTPATRATGDGFGSSVALVGDTAVIGANYLGSPDHQGAAYVFHKPGASWTQAKKLTASDGAAGDDFGVSVALDGSLAIIGADYQYNTSSAGGAAYVFKDENGAWSEARKLSGDRHKSFGEAVALDGDTALIGQQGSAYFYQMSDLDFAVSAPGTVHPGADYTSQTIATNSSSVASAAISASIAVPAAASFVSATATSGSCSQASGVVTCDFGSIDGNAGTAKATVTLKATGENGDTIENTASIVHATPALTASAATQIGNNPPVAEDGTLTTNENKAASGTLVASDPDGDALTFSIVDQPQHGSVKLDDATTGAYTYTPSDGYSGSDSFTFKANDGAADSNVATISITVNAVNQPPVANDGSLTTDENKAASGTLQASDPDGDPLTFSIVDQPLHGSVKLDDATTGAYTYTPSDSYSGSDSFTFKANDGQANSNVATISITVNAGNKPPVADDGSLTTDENEAASGTLQASDPDGDPLTFSIVDQPQHGSVTLTNATTGAYTYTPAADYSGNDSFTFKANDGEADSNIATVSITVNAVNPPSGGGGGALGWLGLAVLLALAIPVLLMRRRRSA